MRVHAHALIALCTTAALAAQQSEDDVDPITLVSRAEALLKAKETENAVLLLWESLDLVAGATKNAANDAVAASARQLLAANDPLDARRRAVFASVSKQQAELSALYRGKKWLAVAATRLEVAEQYDAAVAANERRLLVAAGAKDAPAAGGNAPKVASKLPPLLQRANTEYVNGEWSEVGDCLACQAPKGEHVEWITKGQHGDNEIVVEFRPAQAGVDHNAMLAVGLGIDATDGNYSGYRLQCVYYADGQQFSLTLWRIRGMKFDSLAQAYFTAKPTPDGFHRLSVQVNGAKLRARVDGEKPIEADAGHEVRGKVGVLNGISNASTCAVHFRNLRIDPLPADMPTDEELRAKSTAESQNAISKLVDEAKAFNDKKQPETASLRLREALAKVREMPPGVLRDNLGKNVEQLLAQTDPFTARRLKTAQAIAGELVALADEYEKGNMARAAEVVVGLALGFDPTRTAREIAARDAVHRWNAAQATARAGELAPPEDDGAMLRQWFAQGRKLFGNGPVLVFEGPAARAVNLQDDAAIWLMANHAKPVAKASIHVRLPAPGTVAGFCFDIVDPANFALAALSRTPDGIRIVSHVRSGGQWAPLLKRDVPMDEWRRDGWHRLSVVANADGLVARCNDTEIKVARKQLGKPTGTIALYAGNNEPAPVTVELRAFKVEP